jgi:hypothetical protein
MKKISPVGLAMTFSALLVFSFLFYSLVGWWFVVAAPTMTLFAARPVAGGDRMMWEKKRGTTWPNSLN